MDNQTRQNNSPAKAGAKVWIPVGIAVVAILVGVLVFTTVRATRQAEASRNELEQVLLDNAQQMLQNEYADLNEEFEQFENSRKFITDDSVKRALSDKYEAARVQVEKLQQELKDQKRKSSAEIAKLRGEIETLRALLRHYVEEIDRLNKENEALRTENKEVKEQNRRLSTQVTETAKKNEVLSERMTLAERLNVTGLTLTPLNKKNKVEKKIAKAVQLRATFTIPQNNSTPVGEKTIYMRIISPSGQLLGSAGTFSFEGGNVEYTARKMIEYAGEEIGGINIYYDVNTPLIAGEYTVELFADNFRLISRHFTLQ
ncbi:MAG: hypothetical protein K2M55_06040 [Muribaculaceae bacterium]|nr:hypothetical protein [Muribaculaceae bacterium]